MAPGHVRRHAIYASDQEVSLFERALRCYAQVMVIQTSGDKRLEADETARLAAVVQGHKSCRCPTPIEGGTSL